MEVSFGRGQSGIGIRHQALRVRQGVSLSQYRLLSIARASMPTVKIANAIRAALNDSALCNGREASPYTSSTCTQ